jgi:hypothetical protein
VESPALAVIHAENIIFEPHSEVLSQNGKFFRQSISRKLRRGANRENLFSASRLIAWNSSVFCVPRAKEVSSEAELASGILLNGQTCTNWYHWLMNILPKAFIAEKFLQVPKETPYLVSKSIQGTQLDELLRLVISEHRKVIYLEDKLYSVRRAVVIESPTRENYRPKNFLTNVNWSSLGNFHLDVMAQYRSHLISQAFSKSNWSGSPRAKKILLIRDNDTRPYNQQEIEFFLKKKGFTAVDLAKLSAIEQIITMASSEFVVGPTGAQWASWLFTKNATGLILVPPFLTSSTLFSKLGFPGRSELFDLVMTSPHRGWSDYARSRVPTEIDPQQLERQLDILLQGNS